MTKITAKLFAIMILSTTLSLFYSCSTPFKVINEKKSIGKNQITNADIQADLFFFEDRIHTFYIDSTTNYLTVKLRGVTPNQRWLEEHGHIILFNLNDDSTKWSKKINYSMDRFFQNNNVIIQTKPSKCFAINNETGKTKWSLENELLFTDFKQNIGFGFKQNSKIGNTIEGVDLIYGIPLWKRVITSEYGWNSLSHSNDSTVIVTADGLHSINLKNGIGWDYSAVTGIKESIDHTAANVGGVALGLLTGMYFISYGGYNITHGFTSNIMIDSSGIYWAGKQEIVKLNQNGKVLWEYGLPQDMASKSEIFIKDSNLYMINYGYAYYNGRTIDFGQPFVAAFNRNTGHKVFLNTLNDKKSTINDFSIQNQDLLTISNSRISKFALKDGALIQEKTLDTNSLGNLNGFVAKDLFIKRDSTFKTLDEIDSSNQYLRVGKNKIIEINNRFEVVNQFEDLTLYIAYLEKDGYKFIGSFNETFILDKNGKVVANLKVSMFSFIIGSKLYDSKDNAMIIVDLNDILKKQ